MMADEAFYDELDGMAEAGTLARRGTVSHEEGAGARFLMEATGTDDVRQAQRVALGRPRLGSGAGQSPTVRFKTTVAMRERMKGAARRQGVNVSEVWRTAAREYLQHHEDQALKGA